MKKLLTIIFAVSTLFVFAQTPQGINYQSIIRSTGGIVLPNTAVNIDFKLYNGLAGAMVYHESQATTTNSFGMANLIIGQGSPISGTFNTIAWSNGIAYEVYVNSVLIGTKQLFMSVPYALHAGSAPAPTVTFTNNILSVGGNTTAITSGVTYTAGNGIDITGSVISGTANIIGTGATSVTGIYPNLTINTPTVQSYSAGNGINIDGSGVITNISPPAQPYTLTTNSNSITINNGSSVSTATVPSYSAGNGINVSSTGVITNTASSTSLPPAFNGQFLYYNNGASKWDTIPQDRLFYDETNNMFGIGTKTPSSDLHVNGGGRFNSSVTTTQIYSNALQLTVATFTNAGDVLTNDGAGNGTWQPPVTPTITGTGIAGVTPTTGNAFNVDVPVPVLGYNNGTNVLSLSQGTTVTTATLVGTGTNTTTIVGLGLATVTPTTGSTFTVSVPNPTFTTNGPTTISGAYPNYTVNSVTTASTTLVQGSNVALNNVGNTYTVSTPGYSISLPGGNTVQITNGTSTSTAAIASTSLTLTGVNNTILSAGGNTVGLNTYTPGTGIAISGIAPNYTVVNTAPAVSPTITGIGMASVTPLGNTFTVSVPSPSYTAGTGVLNFGGTNTVVVTPTLALTGTTLTSGAATNSVNLSAINNWSVTTGVMYPATLTNSVGIGTSGPTNGRLGISHTSSSATPHVNLISPAGGFGRIKYTNTGQGNYFSTEARNNGGGSNDGFSISQYNGTNETPVFLINGERKVYINALNLPLGSFHVMSNSTITAASGPAMISEGFGQSGQLILARNNQTLTTRTAVNSGDVLGKLNFSGFNGGGFNDGGMIMVTASEAFTGTNNGSEMSFRVAPQGGNSTIERLKITSKGKVVVTDSLQLPFGFPAFGKVLTSDNFGNASWQAVTAPLAPWVQGTGIITQNNIGDKVGIGTNAPAYKLDISETFSNIGGAAVNILTSSSSGGGANSGIYSDLSGSSSGNYISGYFRSEALAGATGLPTALKGFAIGNNLTSAVGVSGTAMNGNQNTGVYGSASGGTTNYGIFGEVTGSGYAGYFTGGPTLVDGKFVLWPQSTAPAAFMGQGSFYYDNTSNKIMVAENSTTYKPLFTVQPWIQGTGTVTLATNSDKVGIGNGSPISKLEVWGVGSTSTTSSFFARDNFGNPILQTTDDRRVLIGSTGASSGRVQIWGFGNTSATSAFHVVNTAAASMFLVRDDGNVGIGTNSPLAKLHVNGSMAITDGSQGVGKVLVSDASGNASWMPISKMTYSTANCQNITTVSVTPVKFTTNLGTVVKTYSDTHLEVILQADINVLDLIAPANSVTYQLRVSGILPNGNTGKAVYYVDNAGSFVISNNKGITIIGEFEGLAAGTYNIELWAYCGSGSASGVYIDYGCFGGTSVIIKEFK